MELIRTFVAIDLKPNQILMEKWQELKLLLENESVKWVDGQSLHLTLFFVGETSINMADEISQKLEIELKDIPSFKIKVQGFGVFGSPKRPGVIWAGVEKSEPLFDLMKVVRSSISRFGFNEPDGNFSPHFTLGRVRQQISPIDLNHYININKSKVLQEIIVNRVIFYKSILKPTGPIYKPLKEIKLLSL